MILSPVIQLAFAFPDSLASHRPQKRQLQNITDIDIKKSFNILSCNKFSGINIGLLYL